MKISLLTHAEEVLMQIMWKLNSAPLKEILAAYPDPKPHQNTVSTFLKILTEKEFLSVVKEGRIFRYHVAVPREAYRMFLLSSLLINYFENSGEELIKTLQENKLVEKTVSATHTSPDPSEKSQNLGRSAVSDFINEITGKKKSGKKEKEKKKKKKKNK